MRPETAAAVFDIGLALRRIVDATHAVELPEFESHWMLQSAVERQFEIIGEALARIRDGEPPIFDRFADGKRIIGLRNLLAHGYDSVSARVLLEVAKVHVPALIPLIDDLSAQAAQEGH